MIFVAIINIASAILIIIIEKTSLIGLFKAFGASTTKLSGLFIVLAGRILVIGLIVGNILGLGFCILQDKFGLVKLDPEKYILDKVPIDLNWTYVCQINLITLVICVLFMILPVLYVSRIDPVRAIKFD
jgi:lipoprotein-releasing system permease protein